MKKVSRASRSYTEKHGRYRSYRVAAYGAPENAIGQQHLLGAAQNNPRNRLISGVLLFKKLGFLPNGNPLLTIF